MHNGTRTGEGSFNQGLKNLFYLASDPNRHKLVDAFPEFFGDEVPEFGIVKKEEPKKVNYKGWLIKWNEAEQLYDLFCLCLGAYTPLSLLRAQKYKKK